MPIRAIIAGDKPATCQRLRRLLNQETDFEIIGERVPGRQASDVVRSHRPDVLFLDTRRPTETEVLAACGEPDSPLVVLIATRPQSRLVEVAAAAPELLSRTFTPRQLQLVLERLRARLAERSRRAPSVPAESAGEAPLRRFLIRGQDRLEVVPVTEVDWMESANNYIVLHAGRASHILRDTLNHLENRLPAPQFMRVSRFAILNLQRVRSLRLAEDGSYFAVMVDGAEVPFTRGLREVQERLETA